MKDKIIYKIIVTIILLSICYFYFIDSINEDINRNESIKVTSNINIDNRQIKENINLLDDWRLTLVNSENELPKDYKIELANIDKKRQFDKRAINKLFEMQKDMKEDGIFNVWVQSSYRSINYQQELFEEKINKYLLQGKTKEEAERLTLQIINKPGTSEHNLGLAVDFNYVDYSFDETKGFKWLQKNAEKYGFILRYRKDKKDITKVNYEPWHWRYVGIEHAKKINELDMCLEEYIEYLKNN